MSTKTDITINAVDPNNKKITNKITYVNPNISNQQAVLLGQKVNALTTNSYQSTSRTDTTDCDIAKATRTVTSVKQNNTPATLVDGIYKMSTPVSSFTGTPGSVLIALAVNTGVPLDALCYVSNFNAPDNYYLNNLRLQYSSNLFSLYISTSTTPTAGDIIAVDFVIPEDNTYEELRVPCEIIVVADE